MTPQNVAVVGAGIMGSSTALALAERGHRVTLFEQFKRGHNLGSSHGNSRIVRKTYPDALYTEIMQEGYPMWRDLEAKSGRKLLHEVGLLYFGKADGEHVRGCIDSLQSLGVEHEVLDASQVARVFPLLKLNQDEAGVFTQEAGWGAANIALEATLDLFIQAGGTLKPETKIEQEDLKRGYDTFVVCAGSWVRNFADVPVTIKMQTFGYLSSPDIDGIEGPVWIDDATEEQFYGFPSEPGKSSLKMGVHLRGQEIDPDNMNRAPNLEHAEWLTQEANRRFGGAWTHSNLATCLYTVKSDEDFMFGRLGDKGFFASPCSGHGFKFGPWVGKTMADFVEGKARPEDIKRLYFPGV